MQDFSDKNWVNYGGGGVKYVYTFWSWDAGSLQRACTWALESVDCAAVHADLVNTQKCQGSLGEDT